MYESHPRYAGILFHITSLPSQYGIGDLGSAARSFADFLVNAGVSLWQILPICPTGYGNSPYAARSSFAGNEFLISPELLAEEGLLEKTELNELQKKMQQLKMTRIKRVDFGFVEKFKIPLLKTAARRFVSQSVSPSAKTSGLSKSAFDDFCSREKYWLDDYVLFQVLCESYNDARWHTVWDKALAKRGKKALDKVRVEKAAELMEWKALQYFFEYQWMELKTYVNSRGIRIIGDVPIFAAPDSADTWSNPDLFNFSIVSGVPPDYFSSTGQLWGNPVYDWNKMKSDGYKWWVDRIQRLLSHVDLFRIDHFRGFDAYWAVPANHPTAEHGTWKKGPGADFFLALKKKLGKLPVLAEDLGFLTESVIKLRDSLGFPGMKICQFGFEDIKDGVFDARHIFLPHNYNYPWVAYTGTHDNDTSAGWYISLSKENRRSVAAYFNCAERASPADIVWAMIRSIVSSQAQYAIFPLQDLLGFDTEARFNTPSTCNNKNWSWQLWEIPDSRLARRFASLLSLYSRH